MARLALLIGIGLVTAGNYAACAFKSGPNGGVYPTVPDTPGTPGVGTFSSTLTLRNVSGVETDSFVFGEPIRFDFEIFNRTNTQQRVQFPDAQTHEFLVANQAHADRLEVVRRAGICAGGYGTRFRALCEQDLHADLVRHLADGTNLKVGNYQAGAPWSIRAFEDDPWHSTTWRHRSSRLRCADNSGLLCTLVGPAPRIDGVDHANRSPP